MEIPTVSACIAKIADAVSRLPVKLYQKNNGKITEITDDSRLLLLNGETGDTLTTVDMWKSVIEDYFLGNGAWIYINSDGITPKSLHYVDSRNISIMTNNEPIFRAFDIFVNGRKFYDFQFVRLFRKTKTGYSNIPLQSDNPTIFSACYNALKLENSMNGNGGNKRGFLKAKTKLSAEALDTVKQSFPSVYGNGNGKIPVLNDGLDFEPLSSTAVELQINENKKANSTEICKLFGFPHTVIDGGASDNDNKKFTETIVSILNQIETALDAFLLLETEKNQGFYFVFDTKELTRGSLRERYEAYQIAVRNHILQIDEIRREEDYEPLGFNFMTMGLGDVLLNPKTMEVFTPNTGQTSKLGENRAEIELRYNHNHDEKGRFCSGGGSGRMSSSAGNSEKSLDNSGKSDIINTNQSEYYPKSIANVKRGNPMTFDEADHRSVNPNFAKDSSYRRNCQTCVVAYEARLRGYNVEANPNKRHSMSYLVSLDTRLPWIDPKTGKNPEYIFDKTANNPKLFKEFLEKTIEPNQRYTLEFTRKKGGAHIISADRTEKGKLRLYDPQNGKSYTELFLSMYLHKINYYHRDSDGLNKAYTSPQLLRVDNMNFDLSVVNKLLKGK